MNRSNGAARILVLIATVALFLIFGREALAEWPADGGIIGRESTGWFLWNWAVAFMTLGLSCLFAWFSYKHPGPPSRSR